MTTASYYAVPSVFEFSTIPNPLLVLRPVKASAMRQDDDLALIQRVVAQDRQAFETLYQRYYQSLYGYLIKMLHRPELVEEVLNDVMLVVWKDAARFSHKSRLSTWIFGIAYNKGLKAFQKASRQSPSPPERPPVATNSDSPEQALMQQETRAALTQALQALSPEHRSVVEFAFYHGFSYSEIAEMMECPVNTVKTRMFHARRRLGQLLGQYDIRRHEEELR